uniref:Ser/thr-rich glycoprotein ORF-P n=1 Tax=Elephant endotheliotropic herpesvirus 1A TaxID=759753 RepID=A0A455LHK9_ELHV1|nr:ser/thr-rich glycoprotein ORF-P [Elephant endotheliotropic herpesvirus 1A]
MFFLRPLYTHNGRDMYILKYGFLITVANYIALLTMRLIICVLFHASVTFATTTVAPTPPSIRSKHEYLLVYKIEPKHPDHNYTFLVTFPLRCSGFTNKSTTTYELNTTSIWHYRYDNYTYIIETHFNDTGLNKSDPIRHGNDLFMFSKMLELNRLENCTNNITMVFRIREHHSLRYVDNDEDACDGYISKQLFSYSDLPMTILKDINAMLNYSDTPTSHIHRKKRSDKFKRSILWWLPTLAVHEFTSWLRTKFSGPLNTSSSPSTLGSTTVATTSLSTTHMSTSTQSVTTSTPKASSSSTIPTTSAISKSTTNLLTSSSPTGSSSTSTPSTTDTTTPSNSVTSQTAESTVSSSSSTSTDSQSTSADSTTPTQSSSSTSTNTTSSAPKISSTTSSMPSTTASSSLTTSPMSSSSIDTSPYSTSVTSKLPLSSPSVSYSSNTIQSPSSTQNVASTLTVTSPIVSDTNSQFSTDQLSTTTPLNNTTSTITDTTEWSTSSSVGSSGTPLTSKSSSTTSSVSKGTGTIESSTSIGKYVVKNTQYYNIIIVSLKGHISILT